MHTNTSFPAHSAFTEHHARSFRPGLVNLTYRRDVMGHNGQK